MTVPDDVIFGPDVSLANKLMYHEVRQLSSDDHKLAALKRRLDSWLIDQVEPLSIDANGKRHVYSPFPLAVLTCVGVETLAQIAYGDSFNADDHGRSFKITLGQVDLKLSRSPKKEEKLAFVSNWPEEQKPASYADIFYSFFRNTLIHGYHSQGVFLTEDTNEWEFKNGALILNPYWFWKAFKAAYKKLFFQILDSRPSGERTKALKYFERLIA